MSFTVKAELPENQINKKMTYYDLDVKPGQKQKIGLMVTNNSDKEAKFDVSPNQSTTNKNGVVDYSKRLKVFDNSLQVKIPAMFSKGQRVVVKAKSTKRVVFNLTMPKEKFDGIALGGFYVSRVSTGKDEQKQSKSVSIENKFAYVIGIVLQENDKTITPDMKMNKIHAGLNNYQTTVTANLQNIKPAIMKDVKVDAFVTKKDSKTVIHKTVKEKMTMAPNSNFDYPIDWKNDRIEPGKYTMHVKASSENNKYKWSFTKNFEIKAKEASKANDGAVKLNKQKTNYFLYILIGILIILVAILAILVYKQIKNKQTKGK